MNKNPNTECWFTANKSIKNVKVDANNVSNKALISVPIDNALVKKFFKKPESNPEEKPFPLNEDLSNTNVAIIDSSEQSLSLLSDILLPLNTNVHKFVFTKEIIKTLEIIKYDLIIFDISVSDFSLQEFASIIKKSNLNSGVSLIFMSDVLDIESKLKGFETGACSYIEKPYNAEIVKIQVHNLLKQQIQRNYTNKQKENFVAMLVHDLKSPVHAAIKVLELLLNNKFGQIIESQREVISNLLNSAKYMKNITDQVLCFYKCNNSYISLNKEETAFDDLVMECVSAINFMTADRKQNIRLFNNAKGVKVCLDIIEVKRVISNLISNASDYSPEGNNIDIVLNSSDDSMIFTIRDYGYGIKSENLGNIFDEYVSLAKQQKRVGFGLGLHICKKVVQAHNGVIEIYSSPGEGTMIEFSIPLK